MRKALFLFVCLCLGCGCAGLTPAQRTLWAINVYQAQYDMYLEQVIDPAITGEHREALKADPSLIARDEINPDLTEDQKRVLRVKKQILIELKPLVLMAAEYHKTGTLPPEDVQKKLTELINRLVELAED